ncbi:MAG: HAMP domain-containing histidine kinase [Bryobacteraceae bacterium]|nr:HAMP domain-containing histidine kinase [Bryobacteraceae bacterium]
MKGLRQRWLDWSFVALMTILCAILSVLQYNWTGEVSKAESTRLRAGLNERLQRLVRDFDSELNEDCAELTPTAREIDQKGRESAHGDRFRQWVLRENREALFTRIAVAVPAGADLELQVLDKQSARLQRIDWPAEWSDLQENLRRRYFDRERRPRRVTHTASALIELPVFGDPDGFRGPPLELEWTILELNLDFIRNQRLPELIRTHLNTVGEAFDVKVEIAADPDSIVFTSRQDAARRWTVSDGRAELFSLRRGGGRHRGRPGPSDTEPSRWMISALHRAGSLEAVVSKARVRNLAVSFILLSLILIAGSALVRYTRRARRLAELQLSFVAGISHELRTPLTVIRGAGHNLANRVVRDDKQIDRYGQLIVQHADHLSEIIDQLLTFASTRAARTPAVREPVSIRETIERALDAASMEVQSSCCVVEVDVATGLPPVIGDPAALRRAFQNLISNAAKHGTEGKWIKISANLLMDKGKSLIEVRVADHGPGIPEAELPHVFDPFYRGERARSDQIRGTGLGLSLLKEITETHLGSVSVKSQEGKGSEFIVRLPAARHEEYDEFAHSAG